MSMFAGIEKALQIVRTLPRVCDKNLRPLLKARAWRNKLGRHSGNTCGRSRKGRHKTNNLPPIGIEGTNVPFYLKVPMEPYNKEFEVRRENIPVSLESLQRMIDLARVDPKKPIDLTSLCNTKIITVNHKLRQYGVNLFDKEGFGKEFLAKVNVEVQWASEMAIAAIERNGGVITTKYYSPECIEAMNDPEQFFKRGLVIPRCKLPSKDDLEYYSDAKNRGYLADPEKIAEARYELSQKYGYKLPDITKDPDYKMLKMRKDPRQIWYGLEPGWAVNLTDKCILKPTNEELIEYYKS